MVRCRRASLPIKNLVGNPATLSAVLVDTNHAGTTDGAQRLLDQIAFTVYCVPAGVVAGCVAAHSHTLCRHGLAGVGSTVLRPSASCFPAQLSFAAFGEAVNEFDQVDWLLNACNLLTNNRDHRDDMGKPGEC